MAGDRDVGLAEAGAAVSGGMPHLQLSRLEYPVEVLGYGRRAGIWLQGCTIRCAGCIAVDTWNPRGGLAMPVGDVVDWLAEIAESGLDGVTISGGEPTDQPESLQALLQAIRDRLGHDSLDILLFTGRSESWVTGVGRSVVSGADAVMTEPFVQEQAGARPLRGSDNQVLLTFTELGFDRYGVESQLGDRRRVQVSVDDGELRFVGIPTAETVAALATMAERSGLHLRGRSWGR